MIFEQKAKITNRDITLQILDSQVQHTHIHTHWIEHLRGSTFKEFERWIHISELERACICCTDDIHLIAQLRRDHGNRIYLCIFPHFYFFNFLSLSPRIASSLCSRLNVQQSPQLWSEHVSNSFQVFTSWREMG